VDGGRGPNHERLERGTMPKKTTKKKTAKKTTKKKAVKKAPKKTVAKKKKAKAAKKKTKPKTAKPREPSSAEPQEMPAGKKSSKPCEVCNYYGVYLREIFEREHAQNGEAQVGQVFEYLLSDLHGLWNMVRLYGRETPLERLRGEGNPSHYDL